MQCSNSLVQAVAGGLRTDFEERNASRSLSGRGVPLVFSMRVLRLIGYFPRSNVLAVSAVSNRVPVRRIDCERQVLRRVVVAVHS
jgi:hypothetical protein